MSEAVRLQRFLATAGVAARRKAEQLITSGRVTVNGKVVTVLGTKVDPDRDQVLVDGNAVVALEKFYVLLNKPKGCITSVTDDRGRPTVMDYLPNVPVPVKPVGRLDFYTEGVLLLTNDGELAAKLLAPASHVAKTYHAKVHGTVTQDQLSVLRKGVVLEDGTVTQPAQIQMLPSESKYSWVAVTIFEGKHHQVHRMFEALGFRVDKLQRVAFANLTFHHLRVGDARELTQHELNELRDAAGLDRSVVARGRWRAEREDTDIPRRARAKARMEAEAAAALAGKPIAKPPGANTDDEDEDFGDDIDDDELELREAANLDDDDDNDDAPAKTGVFVARPRDLPAPPRETWRGSSGSGEKSVKRTRSDRKASAIAERESGKPGRPSKPDGPGKPVVATPGVRAQSSRRWSGGATDAPPSGDRDAPRGGARGGNGGRDTRPGGRGDRDAARAAFGGRDTRGGGRGDRDARPSGNARGGFGGRDTRPSGGARDARPGARGGFGGRDTRPSAGARGGFGARNTRPSGGDRDARPSGGARGGFGGRSSGGDRDARPSGGARGGFGGRPSGGDRDARPSVARGGFGRDTRPSGDARGGRDTRGAGGPARERDADERPKSRTFGPVNPTTKRSEAPAPAKRGGQGRSFGKRGPARGPRR